LFGCMFMIKPLAGWSLHPSKKHSTRTARTISKQASQTITIITTEYTRPSSLFTIRNICGIQVFQSRVVWSNWSYEFLPVI
jgi:hypothetical protein